MAIDSKVGGSSVWRLRFIKFLIVFLPVIIFLGLFSPNLKSVEYVNEMVLSFGIFLTLVSTVLADSRKIKYVLRWLGILFSFPAALFALYLVMPVK